MKPLNRFLGGNLAKKSPISLITSSLNLLNFNFLHLLITVEMIADELIG